MYNGARLILAWSWVALGQERKKERERENSSYIECSWRAKRGKKKIQEGGEEALAEQPFCMHH